MHKYVYIFTHTYTQSKILGKIWGKKTNKSVKASFTSLDL